MKTLRNILLLACLGALAACTGGLGTLFQSRASQALSEGITAFSEGRYPEAVKTLHSALDWGLGVSEQIKAHKYLAFTHCVSGRVRLCRDEFKKALEIKPNLELEPAEAGHPIWGPVFRAVKVKNPNAKK